MSWTRLYQTIYFLECFFGHILLIFIHPIILFCTAPQPPSADFLKEASSSFSLEELLIWRLLPLVIIVALSWAATIPLYKAGKEEKDDPNSPHLRTTSQKPIVAGALCGAFSTLLVMYQYVTREQMRVYPGPLLIRQAVADFILAVVLLAIYFPSTEESAQEIILIVFILFIVLTSVVLIFVGQWSWLFNSYVLYSCVIVLRATPFGQRWLYTCSVPSAIFTAAFHLSIWRLPLISTDLYRTMVNPFLNFRKAVSQYDFWIYFCK